MKKILNIIVALIVFFSFSTIVNAATTNSFLPTTKVFLNDEELIGQNKIILYNQQYYVPVNDIADKYGLMVIQGKNERSIYSSNRLWIGEPYNQSFILMIENSDGVYRTYYSQMTVEHGFDRMEFKDNKFGGLIKPYIRSNNIDYISVDLLKRSLGFNINYNNDSCYINKDVTDKSFKDYLINQYTNIYDKVFPKIYKDIGKDFNSLLDRYIKLDDDDLYKDLIHYDFIRDWYVGKTYWVKKSVINGLLKDVKTQDYDDSAKLSYFTKITINNISYDSQWQYFDFIVIVDNKQYLIKSDRIEEANTNYNIFDKDPKTIFKWSKTIWDKVEKNTIWIGMDRQMASIVMGKPSDINTDTYSWGTFEQWVYDDYYLYFKNGKLTSWQKW